MIDLLFNILKINQKITVIYVHSVKNSHNFYIKNNFCPTEDYCDFLYKVEDIDDRAHILKYISE